jgi:Transposase DDE domain
MSISYSTPASTPTASRSTGDWPTSQSPANSSSSTTCRESTSSPLDWWWRSYLRRFDIEHTFRFLKQTLGLTRPRLRSPEQADRWVWLLIAAHTQLHLARDLAEDLRHPWERPLPADRLTPGRVRRGFPRIRRAAGVPIQAPKPSRPRTRTTVGRHIQPRTPPPRRGGKQPTG